MEEGKEEDARAEEDRDGLTAIDGWNGGRKGGRCKDGGKQR